MWNFNIYQNYPDLTKVKDDLWQYISKSEKESTVSLKDPVESLVFKIFHMDLLDSGGIKTISGEIGLQHYIQSLSCEEYRPIELKKYIFFKFRDSKIEESNEKVKI